ncbi:hypothetical protein PhaeoP75_01158 [Phaeobacter gallaeciensis]|uniref:Uncharacterized protein n=1 Tax=Phaeobacter gallaeciensis TaxID=60890 RepID=A0AAC9Z7K0_9RHOB|nr:hypothetical protein Gal_01116 [Phaeobacter gallaeciensis DSM 26640]ATE92155.1 hypothetical protein PhaeoP11_01111 [Phaeobacter gallaeciensis]ATE98026.1 hypothetical protein PhaeoP73_02738 [Phaeobacter gallaeciensis]ATF00817.1 hypothetical protein PhaeoP75_01158 [Phaeobacter gallaeciensis]ATF05197.1 hypothetical protein PhaeoP63_01106 [Phaeobacter gallaeciensis]
MASSSRERHDNARRQGNNTAIASFARAAETERPRGMLCQKLMMQAVRRLTLRRMTYHFMAQGGYPASSTGDPRGCDDRDGNFCDRVAMNQILRRGHWRSHNES